MRSKQVRQKHKTDGQHFLNEKVYFDPNTEVVESRKRDQTKQNVSQMMINNSNMASNLIVGGNNSR